SGERERRAWRFCILVPKGERGLGETREEIGSDPPRGYAHSPQDLSLGDDHRPRAGHVEGAVSEVRYLGADHRLVYEANLHAGSRAVALDHGMVGRDTQYIPGFVQDVAIGNLAGPPIAIENDDRAAFSLVDQFLEHTAERRNADAAHDEDELPARVARQSEAAGELARNDGVALPEFGQFALESATPSRKFHSQPGQLLGRCRG